jgi:tape measure domain-containing protein
MARNIEAFKLRTEIVVDATKATSEFKKAEASVTHYGETVKKVGQEATKSFDGQKAGKKWGSDFGASAVTAITGSIDSLGQTFGSLIGTAIAPGVGTAIGSTLGSGIDKALSAVSGPLMRTISQGIELNKVLEETAFEFKTFAGSQEEANKYLAELVDISKDVGILPQTLIEASEKLYDLTDNLKLTRTLLKAAADQAADFGGSVETFQKIADTLGLIAEKGELSAKELKTLFKVGIDAKKYLGEATGYTARQLDQFIKAGRIRGDVASRLIAEGIEREKGGYAAARTGQTVAGRERQFGALMQIRGAEATKAITQEVGTFYGKANEILAGPGAQSVTRFLNTTAESVLGFVNKTVESAVGVGAGVIDGMLSYDPSTMMESLGKLSGFVTTGLKSVFQIQSPSELSKKEVGIPIGLGIGEGALDGLNLFIKGQGGDQFVEVLKQLAQDPRVQAFFKTITWAEGGKLGVMAGGRMVNSGAAHPGEIIPRSQWFTTAAGPSSAAGLFQITRKNWRALAPRLGLTNFSDPQQQMLAAMALMADRPGGIAALQSGDVGRMMSIAKRDWTSTPGSTIGGGGQRSRASWLAHYQAALAGGSGEPVSESNPMPVRVVAAPSAAQSDYLNRLQAGTKANLDAYFAGQQPAAAAPAAVQAQAVKEITDNVPVLVDGIVSGYDKLTTTSVKQSMVNSIAMRSTQDLIKAEKDHADASIQLTDEYRKDARKSILTTVSMMEQIQGALGQVAGQIPVQQVGKKRGLFSKILGIAAPFLSFIPGVGPILSQVASIASSAIGGNYGAAAQGIVGGFTPGGVFLPTPKSAGAGPPLLTTTSTAASMNPNITMRGGGGPVSAGRRYLVGEYRPEIFIPGQSGYIDNGAGGVHPAVVALLERIHATLNGFDSMPADHVVMKGARGMLRAMDNNAALANGYGRRLGMA